MVSPEEKRFLKAYVKSTMRPQVREILMEHGVYGHVVKNMLSVILKEDCDLENRKRMIRKINSWDLVFNYIPRAPNRNKQFETYIDFKRRLIAY